MAKYHVTYHSAATCYGWTKEYDRLDDFEDFINEMRREYSAGVRVYDVSVGKFIFWKDVWTYKTYIDELSDLFRDRRTTTKRDKALAE